MGAVFETLDSLGCLEERGLLFDGFEVSMRRIQEVDLVVKIFGN